MDGIVIVDKPAGMTSYDVLRKLKKVFDTKKIGHGGTLDPFAGGVLVVAINQGTKILRYFLQADKEYVAKLKFGEMTDTYDLTGTVVETSGKVVTEDELTGVLDDFKGVMQQKPPMFSAKKVNGVALYKMARKGIEVERKDVEIRINGISLVSFSFPFATIKVSCSKGTYIRSIANDIGQKLGSFAHLVELKRTFSAPFGIDSAISVDSLFSAKEAGTLLECVIGLNDALSFMPAVSVKEDAKKKVLHGVCLTDDDLQGVKDDAVLSARDGEAPVRLVSEQGELIAIASYCRLENTYKYGKVFLKALSK